MNMTHINKNTGNENWHTPPVYIEAARLAMGSIDTDPASCAIANEIVQAITFFDKDTNGLEQEWYGNVWLNPPYHNPTVRLFCEAVINKMANGEICQAVVLVNNFTETKAGQLLLDNCSAVCFPNKRIKFISLTRKSSSPLQGQMICYFGDRVNDFIHNFSCFGCCLKNNWEM